MRLADERARAYRYRSLAGYMAMADLDTGSKRAGNPAWCKRGAAPPGWRPAVVGKDGRGRLAPVVAGAATASGAAARAPRVDF